MLNLVLVSKNIEGLDKGRAVVSHNFGKGTPAAEDILENKRGKGGAVF